MVYQPQERNSIVKTNMNKSAEYFYSKYPKIFPCPPRSGFDLPEGWGDIVDELCEDLNRLENPPVCTQVKEKMGGLRFYTQCYNAETNALIAKAENKSYLICQACGGNNEVRTGVSLCVSTLCLHCRNQLSNNTLIPNNYD